MFVAVETADRNCFTRIKVDPYMNGCLGIDETSDIDANWWIDLDNRDLKANYGNPLERIFDETKKAFKKRGILIPGMLLMPLQLIILLVDHPDTMQPCYPRQPNATNIQCFQPNELFFLIFS